MRIAIASSDGEMVNEHFGRANRFWIYDISESERSLIMVRSVEPLSTGDKNHPFDQERLDLVTEAIKDCQKVYCTKIGDRPKEELEKMGIASVIYTEAINTISL